MRIIQITDTHLSPAKTHFNGNWRPLAEWIEAQQPDLVIHTGDLALDGADIENDLVFSMQLMTELRFPLLIVPGNHDVGHMPGSAQPMNAERLQRWRRLVGPDEWVHDTKNWRFIGINSLTLGSNPEAELQQFDWSKNALAGAGTRRIAMFAHKPLFVDEPNEGDTGYWSVRPSARQHLRDLIAAHDVALFASGHLHRAWIGKLGSTKLAWAPAAAFIVGPMERDMPGERIVGAMVHTLGDDVHTEIVQIKGMTPFLLDDVMDEVYPRAKPAVDKAVS